MNKNVRVDANTDQCSTVYGVHTSHASYYDIIIITLQGISSLRFAQKDIYGADPEPESCSHLALA